jgi:hypothetical protein
MGRPAKATAKANVAALPDTVETMRAFAALAASLSSEPAKLLRRMLRLTAPVAPTERHVLASAKEAAVAPPGTAGLAATFVALAANQASEPATMEPRTSRQTASVGKTAKHAKDTPRANAAVLLGTAGLGVTSAVPAASQDSEHATPTLEAFRPMGSAARTAKHAKDTPRVSVAALLGIAGVGAISAALVARRALGLAPAALGVSRQMVNVVARTGKLARDLRRVNVVLPLDIAERTPRSAALAASPPLAHATAAPEASAPMETAAAKTAKRARALPKESAAVQTATVAVLPTTAPPAARALSACATPVLALSRLTEPAVARMAESAKALRRGIVAAQTATAALRLTTVVPAAKMLSEFAAAVRAPSQLMETAPRMGRLARARPLETAAALPTTAAIRPLIVALGGE